MARECQRRAMAAAAERFAALTLTAELSRRRLRAVSE